MSNEIAAIEVTGRELPLQGYSDKASDSDNIGNSDNKDDKYWGT